MSSAVRKPPQRVCKRPAGGAEQCIKRPASAAFCAEPKGPRSLDRPEKKAANTTRKCYDHDWSSLGDDLQYLQVPESLAALLHKNQAGNDPWPIAAFISHLNAVAENPEKFDGCDKAEVEITI